MVFIPKESKALGAYFVTDEGSFQSHVQALRQTFICRRTIEKLAMFQFRKRFYPWHMRWTMIQTKLA